MKRFTQLYLQLDQTTKTTEKVEALASYFQQATDRDKVWAIAILSHRRPKRTVNTTLLRQWAAEEAQLPLWLLEESYHVVGDLAETLTLILPEPRAHTDFSLTHWIDFIRQLEFVPIEEKRIRIVEAWSQLQTHEKFVFNKLITGAFRVGVSQQLLVKALASVTGRSESTLAHRLMGQWLPDAISFNELLAESTTDSSKPYPFYLAYALESDVEALGEPQHWQAEFKWDGIRGQLIVRNRELFVWSRGEELVTAKYPEYQSLVHHLPDGVVMDGEILPFANNQPLSFQQLQKRIGRKTVSASVLKDVPVVFYAYDLLEYEGRDIRSWPLTERRALLEKIATGSGVIKLSPVIEFQQWEDLKAIRTRSREFFSEGIMLKRKASAYRDGRRKGDWWKWKVDPFTVDAVMIYAMAGHGRRANLYTDYTFAIWKDNELVPFTKAYSGLTDAEIMEVDRWIKNNTLERFGPVRSVKPELVFEIAFEGIQRSTRHKSGIALRFPRINRWRNDKPAREADSIETLTSLLID